MAAHFAVDASASSSEDPSQQAPTNPNTAAPISEKGMKTQKPPETQKDDVGSEGAETKAKQGSNTIMTFTKKYILSYVMWVRPIVTDWSMMKPVLRSALAAWLCMLCLVIAPVEIALGSASFLVLVGIFISPIEQPLAAIVEREFFTLLLTTIGWAYANLAIFFAHLARKNKVPASKVSQELVYSGAYIEAGPTAICALFLAFGSALLLYLKIKFGPSPFLFASILGCIALDITLVYAPLYPYPFYLLGQAVVVPLALKSAIAIAVSCFFFPKSVNSAFVERLLAVLKPMGDSSGLLLEMMTKHSPTESGFKFDMMHNQIAEAEAGIVALRGSARLLTREISFGLASGEDLKSLVQMFIAMLAPADGISFYFTCIKADLLGMDIQMHPRASEFNTPAPTRPGTPTQSMPSTPTIEEDAPTKGQLEEGGVSSQYARPKGRSHHLNSAGFRSSSPASSVRHHSHELRRRMHNTLHQWQWRHPYQEKVEVGLWESLRYSAVETQLHNRRKDRYTNLCFQLLGETSQDMLKQQVEAVGSIRDWLLQLNQNRLRQMRNKLLFSSTKQSMEKGKTRKSIQQSIQDLKRALAGFEIRKQSILEPFRSSLDNSSVDDDRFGAEGEHIPHHYLFQSFIFCYFEAQYTSRLIQFLEEILRIENERNHWKWWFPKLSTLEAWKAFNDSDTETPLDHDEDPEIIPGSASSLGKTKGRDPEVLEDSEAGFFTYVGISISRFYGQLFRGISLFMIKAGIVTVLVALPSLMRSSAGWAYDNKAIWVVIMAQLSLARHRGEVLFSLASRVIATLSGAILGMLIWYIASGKGHGNPYAMQVVTAFGFTFVMFIRLYLPAPPITKIITSVTMALVVGYSWKDAHNPTYGSPGIGWDITWRRFLEVVIGATAAYVMAVLPPSSSMRSYFRLSHATAIEEIGGMYCQVVTLAATPSSVESKEAINHLIAIRGKVRRLMALKLTISYEWSLRGRWPLARYQELETVELQLSKLLTHAITIFENLGPTNSRLLLRRTHFLDPVFLADCIAILTMCTTSLKTGQPLPQIVPVLIDRYLSTSPGFQVHFQQQHQQHQGAETTTQLPRFVTYDTLCKEEYQIFAVGAMVAYGIVLRLDRLCLAVKALVGETYSVPTDLHYDDYRY
ncbi:hypothetical protein CBS101457_000734 [Exobasidium rhododendri]|nr:hypothetical protein CBS101457_000734 [Exobasidium rhododendri]